MTTLKAYSFTRYLAAKKTVDDRALNRRVWDTLRAELSRRKNDKPLRVLETGAGIGTMIERVVEWGLLTYADYTALDVQTENIILAKHRLREWSRKNGLSSVEQGDEISLTGSRLALSVRLRAIDLFNFIHETSCQNPPPQWDLIIAHAFLDLMDISDTLPRLFKLLKPGGLFYFTINFDGVTLLEPEIDPVLDDHIIELYHRTMDERISAGKRSGDSRTGRRLFSNLQFAGGLLIEAGASDWVVYPRRKDGESAVHYDQDEAYFLHFIIDTIRQALVGHPELDHVAFSNWVASRHAQVDRGELVYIAHQLDFVGFVPPSGE